MADASPRVPDDIDAAKMRQAVAVLARQAAVKITKQAMRGA